MHSVGMPSAKSSVSETKATSAFNFSGFSATYLAMDSPPTSSSPSTRNFTLMGRVPFGGAQRFDGLHVHVHLAFIVRGAASIDVAVAHGRLEGRAVPFFQRIGRLHVVVAVAQHGGFAGRVHPIRVDQW